MLVVVCGRSCLPAGSGRTRIPRVDGYSGDEDEEDEDHYYDVRSESGRVPQVGQRLGQTLGQTDSRAGLAESASMHPLTR